MGGGRGRGRVFNGLSVSEVKCPPPPAGKRLYLILDNSHPHLLFFVDNSYEVTGVIGEGSMSVVCSAVYTRCSRREKVAMKTVVTYMDVQEAQLLRELRILSRVRHPFVVQLLDVMDFYEMGSSVDGATRPGVLTMVLEGMKRNLTEHVMYYGLGYPFDSESDSDVYSFFPEDDCRLIMNQLLRALAYLHSAHVIHGDVKGQNILVGSRGSVKLCDFGSGRCLAHHEVATKVGTLFYSPPEILLALPYDEPNAQSRYTTAVDIWSLGVVFAEMLGHRRQRFNLFWGLDAENILKCIQEYLSVVPAPEADDSLEYLQNPYVRKLVRSMSKKICLASVRDVFPAWTSEEALDLLQKMLVFDPAKRISASEALRHPFIAKLSVHDLARRLRLSGDEVKLLEAHSEYPSPIESVAADVIDICEKEIDCAGPETLRRLLIRECHLFRSRPKNFHF